MSKCRRNVTTDDFDSFADLERRIRAAGRYVRASDDLRPRTLEAARSSYRQRRWNLRVATLAAIVLTVAAFDMPARVARLHRSPLDTAAELNQQFEQQHRAIERGMSPGINPAWALYEAFFDLRTKQSDLINDSL